MVPQEGVEVEEGQDCMHPSWAMLQRAAMHPKVELGPRLPFHRWEEESNQSCPLPVEAEGADQG